MDRILVIRPNVHAVAYPRDKVLALYNIDNVTLNKLIETGNFLSDEQHVCFDIV